MAKIIINPDRAFMLGLKDGLAGRNAPDNQGFSLDELSRYAEGQRAAKERRTVRRFDNTVVFDGHTLISNHTGVSPGHFIPSLMPEDEGWRAAED